MGQTWEAKILPSLEEESSESIDVSPLYQQQHLSGHSCNQRHNLPMLAQAVRERVLQGHINQTFL